MNLPDALDFPIAWRPTAEYLHRSRVRRFMEAHGVPDYETLLRRAVEEPAWFWDAVVRDLGLEFYRPYDQVLDTSDGIEWARWFVGGRCNYVHNAVDRWADRLTPGPPPTAWAPAPISWRGGTESAPAVRSATPGETLRRGSVPPGRGAH